MALQSKLQGQIGFVPAPLIIVKDRSKARFRVESDPIRWDNLTEDEYQIQWIHCLNAVHSSENENILSRDDLIPTFVQYLKIKKYTPEQIALLKAASDNELTFSIVSKAFLLMTTGVDHPSVVKTDKWLTHKLKAVLARISTKVENKLPEVQRRSVQDFKRDKRSELLGELQGLEDEMEEVDILQFLHERSVAKEHLEYFEATFRPRMEELQELLTTKDEQLKEAYACYRKPEIKKMIEWYARLLDDVETYRGVKVATRKTPVHKPRAPDKVVKHLHYMKECPELNIKSVKPEKIVGAAAVWLYNTKTRKLIVYQASAYEKQLTVKGTSIVGFDVKISIAKTLRRPEEQLAAFMSLRSITTQLPFMHAIKATAQALRGRVTEDMVILKVVDV